MKQFWFAFILLAITKIASAQECTYTLKGNVTDYHDGSPLFGALIQLIDTDVEAYTDFDGNFTISGLCDGTIQVQVSHPDCESIVKLVEIKGNTTTAIKLEHHLEEIGEVVVVENSNVKKTNSASEVTINTATIQKYSNDGLGNALKEISGVSSLNTGGAIVKPVIDGMHSSRVLIINNGVRMQDQEWGVEHAPNVDVNTAENITVVKGASALKYGGDAIGGTIVIDGTQPIAKDSLYGKTILTGVSNGRGGSVTSSLFKTKENGWYYKGQGTFKYLGDFEAPDYVLSNTGSREKDFSVGFGLRKFKYGFNAYYSFYNTQIGILTASHIGSVGDLANALESNTPLVVNDFTYTIQAPYQDVTHHLAKVDFYRRFSKLGKLSIQYDFQQNNRKEYDIRTGDDRNKAAMDMMLNTHSLQADFNFDAYKHYKFSAGIAGSYQKNTPDANTGVRRLIPDYIQYNLGAYLAAEHSISDNTILDAGVRYDYRHLDAKKFYLKSRWEERGYDEDFESIIIGEENNQWLANPVFNFHNLSATLGLKTYFTNNTQLNANISLASRAPNASELFSDGLHHSAAIIELGDLRIKQEVAKKVSIGYAKTTGNFTFNVNPYANLINDYVIMQPTGLQQTTRGAFPVWEYSQINALLTGVDLSLGYQIVPTLKYSTKAAYIYAEDLDNNKPVIDIPGTNWSNGLVFTQPKWNQFEAGLQWETVFKQNRYPDNDFEATIPTNNGNVTKTIRISEPPNGYGLLHFNTQCTVNWFRKSDLTIGFSIQNLLNTNYRDYLNRQRYYADDLGRNFKLQLTFKY
ncbi:TonB-dependent receptor [Neptunitalea lumnitzerae]|uniref:Membrane protein n=1 Tax=Neptunitalea lumnitzerae TaxID=2965509 RepID=A0ABQ5MJY6_9FLAO|nr:TonB-dependent receptor [Neptunitalea sp. Y10]GLB49704.1 membrane protein [Neptunitalea sp. Y10]